ncbi:MAG: thiamine pyrophosphate-dependent enzyme [Planctomycetota bacterium]|jgi:phosphonopyruvate decarboxylase|nr:thiamine pyrophosphate-dependent enzyme [Planctomycetota bacterium]MDP7251570.1 thiamine pyrophosphate-dependent enzyme [Planctomycetota bacterium]
MKRSEAIERILENIGETDLALFTTGMISREAFSAKDRDANFYMIGSMGLLAAMGLGIALNKPDRRIVVIEGDGSALMSLGTLPLIAHEAPGNFIHVILDNEAYESTGNQPSISRGRDLAKHAEASGYAVVDRAEELAAFTEKFKQHCAATGPTCLVAKVGGRGSHSIPRIDLDPPDLKDRFRSQC